MIIKSRNLNKDECYACSRTDIKKIISQDEEITVSFGYLNRNHCFDSKFIKRPQINGLIISSFQINKRLNIDEMSPILSFYVLCDGRYTVDKKEIFKATVLPKIKEWYHEVISEQNVLVPGVQVLLVEWTGEGFKLHIQRYK